MIEPLQIVTSLRQYFDNYTFDNLAGLTPSRLKEKSFDDAGSDYQSSDFSSLSDDELESLISLLRASFGLVSDVESLYPGTFKEMSGPASMAAHLAFLQDEQQKLLARSGAGIGGYPMFFKGFNGGLTIAAGVIIENARGGEGDDVIIGNAENNQLVGGKGADILEGYYGADTLKGGPGADVFAYASPQDSLSADGMQDEIVDFQSNDKISLKKLRESFNQKGYSATAALADDYLFELVDVFTKRAGEVLLKQESLRIDLTGNAEADMRIDLPGVTSFQTQNLIV